MLFDGRKRTAVYVPNQTLSYERSRALTPDAQVWEMTHGAICVGEEQGHAPLIENSIQRALRVSAKCAAQLLTATGSRRNPPLALRLASASGVAAAPDATIIIITRSNEARPACSGALRLQDPHAAGARRRA